MRREYKFRQLWECQNGHKRWAYFRFPTIRDQMENINDELILTWGKRTCDCPTHELGEGYSPIGEQQQCTELKDINEKDIYEGDIVKSGITGALGKIHFIDYCFSIRSLEDPNDLTKKWGGYLWWFKNSKLEVIGNIYENPELLKGGSKE